MQLPARLVLAVMTLLALVASGCGGGGDGASTSPGTARLLADTFGAGKPMRSGRLDLTLDVRAQGLPNLKGPLLVHVTGPFQSTGAGRAPKFAFDLDLSSGASKVKAGVISTGANGYLTFAERAYALPAGAFGSLESGRVREACRCAGWASIRGAGCAARARPARRTSRARPPRTSPPASTSRGCWRTSIGCWPRPTAAA